MTKQERMKICEKCPELTRFKTCKICKCFMPAKTLMRNMKCPLGKWK